MRAESYETKLAGVVSVCINCDKPIFSGWGGVPGDPILWFHVKGAEVSCFPVFDLSKELLT